MGSFSTVVNGKTNHTPTYGNSEIHYHVTLFLPGFYWNGGKRRGPGRPPKWVISLLDEHMTGDASPSSVCTEDAVNHQ